MIHPATTTHSQLTAEELEDQGIHQGTIRLSIGTENINDILADLEQAFNYAEYRVFLFYLLPFDEKRPAESGSFTICTAVSSLDDGKNECNSINRHNTTFFGLQFI